MCACVVCASREYYETLQCLYNCLLQCSEDQPLLDLIANRIGHLRTFMEQTCAAANSPTTATTVHRNPPEVTSRRRDDVIIGVSHMTSPPTTTTTPSEKFTTVTVTLRTKDDSDHVDGSRSSKCSETTSGSPKSLSQHISAAPSTVASTSTLLVSAVICIVLRRHCPAWRQRLLPPPTSTGSGISLGSSPRTPRCLWLIEHKNLAYDSNLGLVLGLGGRNGVSKFSRSRSLSPRECPGVKRLGKMSYTQINLELTSESRCGTELNDHSIPHCGPSLTETRVFHLFYCQ